MKFDSHKLVQLKRPNYVDGKLLSPDDFQAEQEYQREKQWQHNRMLHGYGVVVGLEVGLTEQANGSTQVTVSPGYALDGWGREIVVTEPLTVFLPGDRHDLIVYLKYLDHADDDDRDKKEMAHTPPMYVVEGAQLTFEPAAGEKALSAATREDFAIPIARLRRPHHEWTRDRNFRPARTK